MLDETTTTPDTKDSHADISMPVIVSANKEGQKEFLGLMQRLEKGDSRLHAAAEAERLTPYLRAMSSYYAGAINRTMRKEEKKAEVRALTTKNGLASIFNNLAVREKSVLLSEPLVMTEALAQNSAVQKYAYRKFESSYEYNGKMFMSFGFAVAPEGGDFEKTASSTTVPIVQIRTFKEMTAPETEKIFSGIRDVMAFVNHDALHHFTLPLLGESVTQRDTPDKSALQAWEKKYISFGSDNVYEDWAHMGQQAIQLQPENQKMVDALLQKVDRYFDDLTSIGGAHAPGRKMAEAVDYYGTLVGHILTRVFPLNHPVMEHALGRMEKSCAAPEKYVKDWVKNNMSPSHGSMFLPRPQHVKISKYINNDDQRSSIVHAYEAAGLRLAPAKSEAMSYKKTKLMQLIDICAKEDLDDLTPHIPGTAKTRLSKTQASLDSSMISMIRNAAKDAKFKM